MTVDALRSGFWRAVDAGGVVGWWIETASGCPAVIRLQRAETILLPAREDREQAPFAHARGTRRLGGVRLERRGEASRGRQWAVMSPRSP